MWYAPFYVHRSDKDRSKDRTKDDSKDRTKDDSKEKTKDGSKDRTKDKSKERRVKRSGSKEREVEASSLTSKSHQSLKDSSQPEPRPTHRVKNFVVCSSMGSV